MKNLKRRVTGRTAALLARVLEDRWRRQGGIPPAVLAGNDQGFVRPQRVRQLTQRVVQLERTVDGLQDELAEARELNRRLADMLDVVTEVLVPIADRDDDQLRRGLADLEWTLKPQANPAFRMDDGGD